MAGRRTQRSPRATIETRGFLSFLPIFVTLLTGSLSQAEEWARFRGPNGSGISLDKGFPAELKSESNLIWKSPVPAGKSSPVLSDKHVFITANEGDRLLTLCFDRASGKLVWEREAQRAREDILGDLNAPAAASPVTDGENVYVFFQDVGLISYDPSGNLRWKTELGPFANIQGLGSSPIFVEGLIILQVDQSENSYLGGFDAENGELIWKTDRSETDSWATPVVYNGQIVTGGDRMLGAYRIRTGERTTGAAGMARAIVASPVLDGDTLYAFGYNLDSKIPFDHWLADLDTDENGSIGVGEHEIHAMITTIARFHGNKDEILERAEYDRWFADYSGPSRLSAIRIKTGENDAISHTEELWDYERSFVGVIPSPLLYEGVFYWVKNGGILTAMDAATRAVLKRGRVREAADGYSASLVAAEGRIYLSSEAGRVSVLQSGGDWEVISVNDLGAPIYSTPALSGGKIYVRTVEQLYCFGD